MARSATPPRVNLIRTLVLVGVPLALAVALVCLAADGRAIRLDPTGFGFDWLWYRDGMERVISGAPIYDARMVLGPYQQMSPELQFNWNQPPSVLVLLPPFYLLEGIEVQQLAFGVVIAAAGALALALSWPRHWPGMVQIALGVAVIFNPVTLSALYYANLNTVAALGVVLVWVGRRADRSALITLGLFLTGFKLVPAVLIGVWLLVVDRRWKPVVTAAALSAACALPMLIIAGPSVVSDFVATQRNAQISVTDSNIGLTSVIFQLFRVVIPHLVSIVVGVGLIAFSLLRLRHRPGLSYALVVVGMCGLIQNLWVHWLFLPLVAIVVVAATSPRMARLAARAEAWRAGPSHPHSA